MRSAPERRLDKKEMAGANSCVTGAGQLALLIDQYTGRLAAETETA